jgi:lipid-A-disaccharide synthase
VLRHLRRLRALFRALLEETDRARPALAVLVDYPDFNLRLARKLREREVPVAYYVSPQVWAWRRGRIRAIRETVAHMIVIFPFEEDLYRTAGVPVTFVGHPLVDLVRPAPDSAAFRRRVGLDPSRPLIAVLPGSRPQEVRHNISPLAGALRLLGGSRPEAQFALGVAPGLDPAILARSLEGLPVVPVVGQTHSLMGTATLGLVASGTATVEAALLEMPMVVFYRLSPVTYALGRPFVRVPHYAMVNLIAGKEVAKELIQKDFSPQAIAHEATSLLDNPSLRERQRAALRSVRAALGASGASERAAAVIDRLISESPKSLT